jgi:hypothetical protein
MATTINRMFSNVISHLNREELVDYLSGQLTNQQIKKILNDLPPNLKVEILENRFKGKIENILVAMASVAEKVTDLNKTVAVKQELELLKGKILLLKLTQKLASSAGDAKLSTEANSNLSNLFCEYRMKGGTETFHSMDSSTPKNLTEEFILNKYWPAEVQATYKKISTNSFTKWNIPVDEIKYYFKNNFKELEGTEERKRHYFFKGFFISKLKRSGKFIYGIGFDPERKMLTPIIHVVQCGKIKRI